METKNGLVNLLRTRTPGGGEEGLKTTLTVRMNRILEFPFARLAMLAMFGHVGHVWPVLDVGIRLYFLWTEARLTGGVSF